MKISGLTSMRRLLKHRIIVTGIVQDEFRGIRVAPSTYTTVGEIDLFCEAMEKVIQNGI